MLFVLLNLAAAACGGGYARPVPLPGEAQPTADAVQPAVDAPAPASTPTPSPPPPGFWIQPGVPQTIVERVSPVLSGAGYVPVGSAEGAALSIVLNPGPDAALTAEWVYALAAPFPTVPDDVSWEALVRYWGGDLGALPAFGPAPDLAATPDEVDLLLATLSPVGEGVPLLTGEANGLVDLAWEARPALAVVPFEQLEPRWKVITLDGASVLDKALDVSAYPLVAQVGAVASGEAGAQAIALLGSSGAWQPTNRDPARLTVLVMTGVTALARATAKQMEIQGVNFPAQNILPFFADADILHTSNEVSFSPDCPEPEWTGDPVFCSQRDYYTLFETIGLDVVELTGNHINDWGREAFSYTLDVYDNEGLPYYGGGRNLEDATAARILTAPDGTRIVFIGCNSAGPFNAWATDDLPGAAPCDDWTAFKQRIAALKADNQADLVVATLQYVELPYYAPTEQQRQDFEALAAAGADIVSGSQAHQPQGFSFADGSFVHFGVGNLFFDQMDFIENRQMFADKHILYEGRHISTVLFTGMMEAWAQPRPMTAQERAEFLPIIFEASGW